MIIEKNNLNIPDNLNKEFFEKSLENGLNCQNVEVKSLNFTMGCSGGENYCSFIYRVEVIYTQAEESSPQQVFLIVKSIPYDGAREIFEEMNVYGKEKQMYLEILPKIQDCLNDIQIAPKCYYAVSEPTASIVFEDMKASGYDIADRITGLDEEHCKIILQKLAQYHAGSMLLLEKDPSIRESKELQYGLFAPSTLNSNIFRKATERKIIIVAETISKWSGYENISEKMRHFVHGEHFQRTLRACEIAENDIIVLNHGDMWVNNFLFMYKDYSDKPTDAVLIDFQGSFCGSLGLDINYFLGTSPKLDVLINRTKSLIENSYYATFKNVLETGGFKNIPTLEDINNEIKKKAFFGFFSTISILPLISMNKEESANNDIEKIGNDEISERKARISCSSQRYLETIKFLLKKFEKFGIFD